MKPDPHHRPTVDPIPDQLLIESVALHLNLGWTLLGAAQVEKGFSDPSGVSIALGKSREALAAR